MTKSQSQREFLSINLDKMLEFEYKNLKRAYHKLYVIVIIYLYITFEKRRITIKTVITKQFSYWTLVWILRG